MLDIIPDVTIVRDEEFIRHPWLKSTFDQLSAEFMSQNPGSELICRRIGQWADDSDGLKGGLA